MIDALLDLTYPHARCEFIPPRGRFAQLPARTLRATLENLSISLREGFGRVRRIRTRRPHPGRSRKDARHEQDTPAQDPGFRISPPDLVAYRARTHALQKLHAEAVAHPDNLENLALDEFD